MSVVVHVYLFHRNQVMKVIDTSLFLYCEIFFGGGKGENFSTVPFHQRWVHGECCGINVSLGER